MNKNIGKFFFRYRNILGPLLLILVILTGQPSYPLGRPDLNIAFDVIGVVIVLMGQALRIVTIGYEYIERGGKNRPRKWDQKGFVGTSPPFFTREWPGPPPPCVAPSRGGPGGHGQKRGHIFAWGKTQVHKPCEIPHL